MDLNLLKGIYVPIITPVTEDEEVDLNKLKRQVNFVIEKGVHGILAHGSNSEFYMFDDDDYELITRTIVEETKGRVPVLMGIGAIRTSKAIRLAMMAKNIGADEKRRLYPKSDGLAMMAKNIGADGLSILQPMFIKPNDEELFLYFKSIAEAVESFPILLYNNPRIGYTISASIVEKLAKEIPNIVGMKDSSGDINQLMEFIRVTRNFNFKIFGGKDTMIYASLAVGAAGAVCSTANIFPEIVTEIYNKFVEGDLKASLELQYKFNPVRIAQDKASFPVATKDMANINRMDVGLPIKPSLPSREPLIELFRKEMKEAGLLIKE